MEEGGEETAAATTSTTAASAVAAAASAAAAAAARAAAQVRPAVAVVPVAGSAEEAMGATDPPVEVRTQTWARVPTGPQPVDNTNAATC